MIYLKGTYWTIYNSRYKLHLTLTRKILEEQLNEQLTKDENGYVGRDKKEEKKLVSELESLSNLLQSDPENQELISKINETDIKLA